MQLHEYTSFDGLGLAQLLREGSVSAADTAPVRSSWASPKPSKLVYSCSCISYLL